MRWLALVVLCSSCSLVYDVDGLRRDGGADSAVPDSVVPDGDVGTDTPPDTTGGSCTTSSRPRPEGLEEAGTRTVMVSFGSTSASDETYTVQTAPGIDTALTLPAESTSASIPLDFPVAVFQPPMEIRDADNCAFSLDYPFYDAEILSVDGEATLETSFVPGASMDISDDGVVVFASSSIGTADSLDDIFQWAPDGAMEMVAESPSGVAGLAAPRISDDGRAVVYWQASDSDGLTGKFHFIFDRGPSGTFEHETGSITTDLRTDSTGTGYHFAMREWRDGEIDELFYGALSETALMAGGSISLTSLAEPGRSPLLRLNGDGTVDVAYAEPVASTDPGKALLLRDVPPGGPPIEASACTVMPGNGLVASNADLVAFVGDCDGVGPTLHVRQGDVGVSYEVPEGVEITGLLSADQAFETFLVRGDDSRWVMRHDVGSLLHVRQLDRDAVPGTGTFLDTAALSPNGEWVALALADPGAPTNVRRFRLARVRVWPVTP